MVLSLGSLSKHNVLCQSVYNTQLLLLLSFIHEFILWMCACASTHNFSFFWGKSLVSLLSCISQLAGLWASSGVSYLFLPLTWAVLRLQMWTSIWLFMWALRIGLKSPGFCNNCIYLLSHLPNFCIRFLGHGCECFLNKTKALTCGFLQSRSPQPLLQTPAQRRY